MDLDTQWSAASFEVKAGRDPLGLQTITTDRIMPVLIPGILALSQRARYLSFHLFALDEYARRRLPADRGSLSDFVRRLEYDLALATQICPKGCGELSGVGSVGRNSVSRERDEDGPFKPAFSVKSPLGGYGLYYRSPLLSMGLVAREGTPMGGESGTPTPIDVIDSDLGIEIADAFRARVEDTEYYRRYLNTPDARPRAVLLEYSERACLCGLDESPAERALLRRALFETRAPMPPEGPAQRRRSFAFWLELLKRNAAVEVDGSAFRHAVWERFLEDGMSGSGDERSNTMAAWAALVAREALQECWSSIWADFCREGLERQGPYGLDPDELPRLVEELLARPVDLPNGSQLTIEPTEAVAALISRAKRELGPVELEELRVWVEGEDSLAAGVLGMLLMRDQMPTVEAMPAGWDVVGGEDGASQPGLLRLLASIEAMLSADDTVGGFARHFVDRFVVEAHERVAYAKLPEFTFRFRWSDGRLRFFEKTMTGRFTPGDIRQGSLEWLSFDIGLYEGTGDTLRVTRQGEALIAEAFG